MMPLNGHSRMTPDERNARRRELDANPFHRALTLRTQARWRAAHKDELNARRRAKYAADPAIHEAQHARYVAANAADPEGEKRKRHLKWKKWSRANRAKLIIRDRKRAADPEQKARKRELRRKRMENPTYRALQNARKRYQYHKAKHSSVGLRWLLWNIWMPTWKRVVADGPERVEKYLKRCAVRTRSYFVKWQRNEIPDELMRHAREDGHVS